ncbi:LysR family transcriptional regulator [Undibacterium sp. TJN19]|uniref:LysR family transcriptional regulator n=1 Tax=Undibacterium sp. TJN19 TaxID=3413055 RepID=UPI003BF11DD8
MDVLGYMRLFVEVGKRKSFRQAAEALGIANSTLSRNIADLESSIGVRLLNRSTRRVELTETGEEYFKLCQSIVEDAQNAHETLLNVTLRPMGTLKISMTHEFAVGYLAPILSEFANTYPLIKFEFDVNIHPVDFIADRFDLAIRMGKPPVIPGTLVVRKLRQIRRYLYASPEYLKLAPPLEHPTDLANHVLCIGRNVSKPTEIWRTLHKGSEKVDLMGGSRFVMNTTGIAQALAVNGLGIAALDPEMARCDVSNGRLQSILADWKLEPVNIYIVTETRHLPAKTKIFIAFLQERLGTGETDNS